jgi:DNA (cytosine-5)-methyltransferase 1
MENNKLRVANMFCGCGGLDYDFHKNQSFKVIYANDFDKDSCISYKNFYNFQPELKDIKEVKTIPDCDIITGGFPCQGFSIANLYRSEEDERNELYKELVRLLKLKKPKYFIFENVKGILSLGGYDEPSKCSGINKNKTKCKSKSKFTNNTDSKINYCRKHYKNLTDEERKNYIEIKKEGKIFKTIIKELQDCGYNVHTKLFKMKWYDIPQNRERVIFLGIREDIGKNIIFKWPVENQVITKTLRDAIGDLSIEYNQEIQHIGTKHKVKITGYMGNRQLDWDKISPTITGRGSAGGGPVINVHPSGKRRMTVREYARIQTFPDEFMFHGSISSKYRQIGNAVPVKFSKILTKIILSIDNQL